MSEPNECRCAASRSASPWILRWLERLPPGATVLDFAAGSGRHALAACERGLRVVAIDRDEQALARLHDATCMATRATTGATTGPAGRADDVAGLGSIALRVADLEAGPWPFEAHERFDAVVVANYLFRPRFALLAALVAPNGLLVYETFAQGNERYGRPSNPAFLLAPEELCVRARRAGLTVIGYEAGIVQRPAPAAIQRVCAVRTRDAEALATLG
ncbi:MAG: SAM-dependent methyltransferase [Burkholderiaceae bacterium]|nr:SAM-dependent methyltransferase [Burkholderiaceae bacterium]